MNDRDSIDNKPSEEAAQTQLILEAVEAGIQAITHTLTSEAASAKGSVSDLIRLLQLRKELAGEQPRHITVRWIGEDECTNSSE